MSDDIHPFSKRLSPVYAPDRKGLKQQHCESVQEERKRHLVGFEDLCKNRPLKPPVGADTQSRKRGRTIVK